MAKVITLEGLPTTTAGVKESKCEMVTVHSPTLGKDVQICREDAAKVAGDMPRERRRRGRPRGTTVKNGAKKPRVGACDNPRWLTKGKRSFCRCGDKDNAQMLSNVACGRKKKKGD